MDINDTRSKAQHYFADIHTEGPPEDEDFLQPFLHRGISLNYQESQIGQNFAIFRWLHSRGPCINSKYRVGVYSQRDINNAELQSDLTELMTFEATEKNLNISTQFLEAALNEINYFRVSSVQDNTTTICEASAYFHQFVCTGYYAF